MRYFREITIMCKQDMKVDETTSEISPDSDVDSQPEKNNDCVHIPSPIESEEGNAQMNLFSESTDNDIDKTESEKASPDESIVSEDEPMEQKQDPLKTLNENLLEIKEMIKDNIVHSQDENNMTKIIENLSDLKELFERQIDRNQNHITMFDKMYNEMKPFKENSLIEAYQKPIIQNLIHLFDEFSALEGLFENLLKRNDAVCLDEFPHELAQFKGRLDDFHFELEETLYRIDVTPYEENLETLDKKLHKTRDVKETDDPEKNLKVAKVHKRGFNWRDKVLRREEVTIYRHTTSKVESQDTTNKQTMDEEGGKTDE